MNTELPLSDKQRILRERARALAVDANANCEAGATLEVIEFALAHERYAVESRFVREVLPLQDLTPVPCCPAFVRGLVNRRGQILAVLDLKRFFDLPERGITDLHSVLFIEAEQMEFGLLADHIVGTRQIPLVTLQAGLPTLTEIRADYLKGVTPEHLVVLDIHRMVTDPRLMVHDEVKD